MELRRPERISAVKRGCSRQPLSAHQPNVERGYRASPQSAFEVSGHELVRSYVPDSPDVRPSKRMWAESGKLGKQPARNTASATHSGVARANDGNFTSTSTPLQK